MFLSVTSVASSRGRILTLPGLEEGGEDVFAPLQGPAWSRWPCEGEPCTRRLPEFGPGMGRGRGRDELTAVKSRGSCHAPFVLTATKPRKDPMH